MEKIFLAALLVAALMIAGCAAPSQPQTGAPQGGAPSGVTPSGGAPSGGSPSGGTPSGSGSSGAIGGEPTYPQCVAGCDSALAADVGLQTACKAGCAIDAAKASKDPSVCDNIKQLMNASLFYVGCLSGVNEEVGNVNACNVLTNSSDKDMCILMSDEKVKDPSICNGVTDPTMKSACMDDENRTH